MLVGLCLQAATAQNARNTQKLQDEAKSAREEARLDKSQFRNAATSSLIPTDFNDTDSFGKNVIFLGSLYAGTLYIAEDCTGPLPAPDDHCVVHSTATPMATVDQFDPAWQITIPAKTVKNVIYPLLNNGVGYKVFPSVDGQASIRYTPRVTIVSDALNDPLALYSDGTPMNGTFTTSLAGTRLRTFSVRAGEFSFEADNYASVGGLGLSRAYFRAIGLPNSVIDKLFNKDMTLKFGIRARLTGAANNGAMFYTFRLVGN